MAAESNTVAAGLLVAMLAAIPLASVALTDASPEVEVATTTATGISTTTTQPINIVTTPPPDIDGLSESIVRVLISNGFAAEEQAEDLPASVLRTLADHRIALTIAEGG